MKPPKHTQGPWKMADGIGEWRSWGIWIIPEHAELVKTDRGYLSGHYLVQVYEPLGGIETAKANARLIAAAPDLLEALFDLLISQDASWEENNMGHDWHEACEKARTAIAKAKGN